MELTRFRAKDWTDFRQRMLDTCQDRCLRDFYLAATYSADQDVNNVAFVALDFETTGLSAQEAEIVSIGLVPFTAGRIQLHASKSWLIKPKQVLTEESIVIHGITHNDVAKAPDLTSVLGEVLACLKGKVVVVHFKHIERDFLFHHIRQRLGETLLFPVIDTMGIEARLHRDPLGAKLKRLFGGKPVSIRLGDTRPRYGLPRYPQHSAITDALATAELLQAQLRHHYAQSTQLGELWE